MSDLPFDIIRASLSGQPLFEDKTWQLSPEAWPLTSEQAVELREIGATVGVSIPEQRMLYLPA